MGRMIDQVRALKLPSNMMQFAARGALSVPPAENLEILVYLATHNRVFGELARMTLAGWDEKASLAAASDSTTEREVLEYFVSPENLRPRLLPALVENPSVTDLALARFATSASAESIAAMLKSPRVRASVVLLDALRPNPYLKKEDSAEIDTLLNSMRGKPAAVGSGDRAQGNSDAVAVGANVSATSGEAEDDGSSTVPDAEVSAYLAQHAGEIAAEEGKPFQPIGGVVDFSGAESPSPVEQQLEVAGSPVAPVVAPAAASAVSAQIKVAPPLPQKRDNTVQKINRLDVKGRIQLALKGTKEERSLLIRDGTKVVALAVLESPKLTDGEVEKFASQKNVQESVLRAIPLKRRFMKIYPVVRNLVGNPRTPLDLGLGLMKHLLVQDLKNLSGNKEVSETVRKLALKMFKQKLQTTEKK
jgi:hypothetical protein